ncbi:MAG: hypothetical protein HYY85_22580 [Deltaproteobacteria bacterium]|nr:hypothetical protein [Deltaproteobacteria bacterium]
MQKEGIRRGQLSRLRQGLLQLRDDLGALLEVVLAHDPVVKGTVYALRRRCGKPTCRCATGALHETWVLSWSEGGRTRLRVIPAGRLEALRQRTRAYQQLRGARARLGAIHREMLTLIDQIERLRRQEP